MLRSSRWPSEVASSASSIEPRVSSGSSSSRPSSRTRTPWRRSSSVSLRMARLEQAEQAVDLVVRAGPVLAAEGVQGQDRDTAPDGVAEDLADGLDAGGMSVELRQALLAGPAAVAVHDDRDVARQLVGRQECGLSRAVVGRGRRSIAGAGASAAAAGSWADGGASVGRASGARATRPRGPPVPWRRRVDRPRRCGGRSSSGARRSGDAPRRLRPCRRALPS